MAMCTSGSLQIKGAGPYVTSVLARQQAGMQTVQEGSGTCQ